jgi:hypothetical protein
MTMAKKNGNGQGDQAVLPGFELNPEIKSFGIGQIKGIGGGTVEGTFVATTEANDTAMLTTDRWADAAAGWLVKLCGGNLHLVLEKADIAYERFWAEIRAREKDAEIGYARTSNKPAPAAELAGEKEKPLPEGVGDFLAALGLQVSADVITGWTDGEIAEVRTWLEAAKAAQESGQEFREPMPACLADNVGWLNGAQPARDADQISEDAAQDATGGAQTGEVVSGGEESAAARSAALLEREGDCIEMRNALWGVGLDVGISAIAEWTLVQMIGAEDWVNACKVASAEGKPNPDMPEWLLLYSDIQQVKDEAQTSESTSVMPIPATVRKGGKRGNGAAANA